MIEKPANITTNVELRRALYAGTVYRIPATSASRLLVQAVNEALAAEFPGAAALRKLQFELSGEEFFARIGKLRKQLFADPNIRQRLYELLAEQGFDQSEHALDPLRMRAVTHKGHENPLAAPAYTCHRDSWYANPQSQINWWIPLHDVTEAETFAFFEAYFDKPVSNSSGGFDYDEWMANIGWQSTGGKPAVYPSAAQDAFYASTGERFACNAGDIILFSASQLHQTTKNEAGLTRFSVDFRTVHMADEAAGLGARNVDNASKGSALKDYLSPVATQA